MTARDLLLRPFNSPTGYLLSASTSSPGLPQPSSYVVIMELQNTIHRTHRIDIGQELAGSRAGLDRALAVGHYTPIDEAVGRAKDVLKERRGGTTPYCWLVCSEGDAKV